MKLRQRLHALSRLHPRYGYRRIQAVLKAEGWRVNRKKVQRLWREEGLRVSSRARKRRRSGRSSAPRQEAEYPLHVWSWDFVEDRTADGRRLKVLTMVDEFTRFCLILYVARAITARDAILVLERAMAEYGCPEFIRNDNGPEFVAQAMQAYLAASGIGTQYIDPGSPWQNAYAESFNGKLRDECLDRELFGSLLEARVILAAYREEYNKRRPHSSLGYLPPLAFWQTQAAKDGVGRPALPAAPTSFRTHSRGGRVAQRLATATSKT